MIVNGTRLQPDAAGALYWPDEQMLVVSDMHFEKASAYARRGLGLAPPLDSRINMDRLTALLDRYRPARLLSLGDSFHDAEAWSRLTHAEQARLCHLAERQETIWISGNHDPDLPADLPGIIAMEYVRGPLLFRHEPTADAHPGEVAGHLHPKARVHARGRNVSAPCFASDGLRLVMPAFGAFTGGLDVTDAAFRPLFPRPFHAWMCVNGAVHAIPSRRLVQRTTRPARAPGRQVAADQTASSSPAAASSSSQADRFL